MTPRLSRTDLQNIAANASCFWDRAEQSSSNTRIGGAQPQKVEARLQEWIKVVAEGDDRAFDKRLIFDGLSFEDARRLLATVPAPCDLPTWAEVLNDVLLTLSKVRARVTAPRPSTRFQYLNVEAPVPFEELVVPFVEVAREKITKTTDGLYSRLPLKARANFERGLLKKLSELMARVLLVEFRTFLACNQLLREPTADVLARSDGRANYLHFIDQTYETGWATLFQEYPVLARLLATALINWVDATAEFLHRFERDITDIRWLFFSDQDVGELVDLQSDLSDSHNGGRTVVSLTFRSGARLIYKPKNLSLEVAYFRLVDWLNQNGSPLPCRLVMALDRGDYGWVEFIESRPCETENEAKRYYRRLGMFLCLVYVLNGIDFHFENVIACGEHPTPVDLETIYHPVSDHLADDDDPITTRLRDSILRADILPNPVKLHDRYYDLSPIARAREKARTLEYLRWTNVNTDRMDFSTGNSPPRAAENASTSDNRILDPTVHVDEMAQGFREMYRYLRVQREKLLEADSPLRQMFRCPARFLFRATTFYQSILNKALNPDHLRHGTDFSIQLDVLSRKLLKTGEKPRTWPLVHEEAEALLRYDVPKFSACGYGTSFRLRSGETLRHCFARSAWESAESKLRALSEDDLSWQIRLFGAAMDAHAMRNISDPSPTPEPQESPSTAPVLGLTKDQLLRCAMDLARDIETLAMYGNTGEPSWLVLNYLPEADQFAVQAISLDLYNGRCGLALFFSALERCAPGLGYRELSYATVAPVRRWLARAGSKDVERMGLGGLVGFPSVIYALTRIGTFLGDSELPAEARRATDLINRTHINADKRLDVMGGAAGAILCLLACHDTARGGADTLDKAIACGHHLLARRELDKCGARTWATFAGKHLTGFSHGASGIAYALLRLFEKTAEKEFLAAAQEAIHFENSEFVPERNNWPDRRPGGGSGDVPAQLDFKVAWCSGAPGIGLARLAGLHILDCPGVRRDVDAALTTSRSHLLQRDHLCCGNLGLAETILKAGMELSNQNWISEAIRLASQVAKRADQNGTFGVVSPSGFFNPTLFQGAAGVGYEFLRLAFADKITSVLMLE
jgi:type 2 lantibiotic biosynthesis protein LanM